jgi:hypothetical protein
MLIPKKYFLAPFRSVKNKRNAANVTYDQKSDAMMAKRISSRQFVTVFVSE